MPAGALSFFYAATPPLPRHESCEAMARLQAFVAVAVVAAVLSAAGADAAASTACDAPFHATLIVHLCSPIATGAPGSDCCHVVLLAAEHGGLPCLCMVARHPADARVWAST